MKPAENSQKDAGFGEDAKEWGSGGGGIAKQIVGYGIGLFLATGLTITAFWIVASHTHLIYGPAIPILIVALAIAQMGVHLAFFIHITTAPDNTNNILALAFGIFIVCLVIFGSLWIMGNLNRNMMPMDRLMLMQR